jgi:hypothetical protein
MAQGYSIWVAGNSVVAQEPHHFSRSWVDGSSATFKMLEGAGFFWFQFSVPTPTRIASEVASLQRVMLLYRSDPPCSVPRVDLWDGPNLIQSSEVSWVGDYSHGIQLIPEVGGGFGGNVLPVRDGHQMSWGLNVSLGVWPASGGDMTFISIGADFEANT